MILNNQLSIFCTEFKTILTIKRAYTLLVFESAAIRKKLL